MKKKKYRELKESIRMMNTRRSDSEKIRQKIGINEVINNSLK